MKERGASFKLFTSVELVVSFRQEKGREMIGESAQGLMLMVVPWFMLGWRVGNPTLRRWWRRREIPILRQHAM